MKLHKVLTIGGKPYDLVKDDVRLDAKSPGRATFNQGEWVTSVTLTGNQMAIKWKTQSAAA